MDCEKFDQCVMDALYGELDEPSMEAFKRHVEGCGRCGPIWGGFRTTKSAVSLPKVAPPADLVTRIVQAERAVVRTIPIHRRMIRLAAWAGSIAMRPQLAMAAVFMLMIGSSVLLLRGRPGLDVERTDGFVAVQSPTADAQDRQSAPPEYAPRATIREGNAEVRPVAPPHFRSKNAIPADPDTASGAEDATRAAGAARGGTQRSDQSTSTPCPPSSTSARRKPELQLEPEPPCVRPTDGTTASPSAIVATPSAGGPPSVSPAAPSPTGPPTAITP